MNCNGCGNDTTKVKECKHCGAEYCLDGIAEHEEYCDKKEEERLITF